MNTVKTFWDNQAKTHGTDNRATAPDSYYRDLEIRCILQHLRPNETVLDVGCGNGYSTLQFAAAQPTSRFVGFDFSEPMIDAARKAAGDHTKNVIFHVGDVRDSGYPDSADTTVTERCLINLPDWDTQKAAIANLRKKLKPSGRLILVENTIEGLVVLNDLRKQFGLSEIKQPWHNRYMSLAKLHQFFSEIGLQILCEQNIGNLYYIISRVLHAKLAADEGKEPAYDHPINAIAAQLPIMPAYHYSPNVLWVLRKL